MKPEDVYKKLKNYVTGWCYAPTQASIERLSAEYELEVKSGSSLYFVSSKDYNEFYIIQGTSAKQVPFERVRVI